MTDVSATIEIEQPVRTVYNQWTQFEEFPRFMDGVEEVRQLDDTTLAWRARIAGVERSWKARITEQEPDRAIAWTSIDGVGNSGRVSFEPLGSEATRISLSIDIEPEGVIETAGVELGIVQKRAREDLERFRDFMEGRLVETGGWRGEIRDARVRDGDSDAD
jgi:uncharacterized membrane protein